MCVCVCGEGSMFHTYCENVLYQCEMGLCLIMSTMCVYVCVCVCVRKVPSDPHPTNPPFQQDSVIWV